jgi:hypothetical protein
MTTIENGKSTVFINDEELDFTTEQLEYFEKEMRAFRLPLITRLHKKYGVWFARFCILPLVVLVAVLGIIYNGSSYGHNQWMWTTDKTIAFFLIFGFGGFTLLSFIFEKVSTNRLRKRLGLSKHDFNLLVIAFQITGMTN